MAELRHHIHRRLTDEERERHHRVREQVERERSATEVRARAKKAELESLREALRMLKREREARGLSLADVAERSGIDKSRLSKLENAAYPNPTLDTLARIASAIGVKLTIGMTPA